MLIHYIIFNIVRNILQKNYQLLFNHTFSNAWNLNVALHYTKGDGYYEEYKDMKSKEIAELVKQRIQDKISSIL